MKSTLELKQPNYLGAYWQIQCVSVEEMSIGKFVRSTAALASVPLEEFS